MALASTADYDTIDLSIVEKKSSWVYDEIKPGSYVFSNEIPFVISDLVQFDYESGLQQFHIDKKVSEIYVFLNTNDAYNDEYGKSLGWINLEFDNGEKIKKEVIVGKDIRNYETDFVSIEESWDTPIQKTENEDNKPVISKEINFICKDYDYEHDFCTHYYHPNFEFVDMLKISIPFYMGDKILKTISLEGNPDGYSRGFVSAITVKLENNSTSPTSFVSDGIIWWVVLLVAIFGVFVIVMIFASNRGHPEHNQPRGTFSKRTGRFVSD